jgi:hypothetical protein
MSMPSSRAARWAARQSAALRSSALERGVAYPAGYLEGDTLHDRRETKDGLLDTPRVLAVQHAHVDLYGDLWRDHVRSQSTVDRAHVHRDSPLAIIECEQPLDLVGDLEDRAGAFIGVEARMARRDPRP